MSSNATRRAAWSIWAITLTATLGTLVLVSLNRTAVRGGVLATYLIIGLISASFATAGASIASRVRGNAIGWILLVMGLALALGGLSEQYVLRGLVAAPGSLPATGFMAWLGNSVSLLIVLPIPIVFLLFPTGRPTSRRWGSVLRTSVAAAVVGVVATVVYPGEEDGITNSLKDNGLRLINPTGIRTTKSLVGGVLAVAGLVGVLAAVLAIASVVLRFRKAGGEEREQIKWLAFVAVGTVVLFVLLVTNPLYLGQDSPVGTVLWVVAFGFGLLGIPAAVAIAILKYRLYDIDVVINKTLVYGSLAAFITAVYVAIVVGIGAALGHGTSNPNLSLSILATAVVAVAFQPVRERVQRFANRLVYGKRASPYEVLSEFSTRLSTAVAAADQLPRMARTLAEGTGAASAAIWLGDATRLHPAAWWPQDAAPGEPDGSTLSVPVFHHDEQLGAISLSKALGERLRPAEEQLARDLASQAGLVLHNVRLTAQLEARFTELRASRRRLVAAQDAARRRLERNIHDGAQQQLVALSVKTNLARQLVAKDPDRAETMLNTLRTEARRAVEDLDELARGIVPAALSELGLVEALRVQGARAAFPVSVEAPGPIPDLPPEVEAAVYFCVLEALQNVAKYAGASRAVVRLSSSGEDLRFEVLDDGRGFDTSTTSYGTGLRGIAERLGAHRGNLRVDSAPGAGTTVKGMIPLAAARPPAEENSLIEARGGPGPGPGP